MAARVSVQGGAWLLSTLVSFSPLFIFPSRRSPVGRADSFEEPWPFDYADWLYYGNRAAGVGISFFTTCKRAVLVPEA